MGRIAILDDPTANSTFVKNVVEKDAAEGDAEIDVTGTDVSKNWQYDAVNNNWSPAPAPERAPKPDPVSQNIGIDVLANLLREAASLSKADVLAIMKTANADIAYVVTGMQSGIKFSRDMQDMQDALNALVADGHLTSTQRTAVEDNWPTA